MANIPDAENFSTNTGSMPAWSQPEMIQGNTEQSYKLKVSNSLTRSKVPFIPKEDGRIYWYMCGPTVYDSAHMGHARTYVAFDIIRRILRDYFHYDVVMVMNITDIDDKIIMRSNERNIPFTELARFYEQEFMDDMAKLGVTMPEAITRVSEYIPQVIDFISGIIQRGFAYESNGSVYFDVQAYQTSETHVYGKLVPENVGNAAAAEEGEGALSTNAGQIDKRNACDFALWKASKEGEPSWDSPWGSGRPGWHIECSAMASDALREFTGGSMDIHSGGIDLRFPHHDNEIAQSEAALGCCQWVNYFIHSGHLHIEGRKMAKSLKNFIRINDALNRFSARHLRLLFLGKRYNAPMEYSEDAMGLVVDEEKKFREFFGNVKSMLRELARNPTATLRWESRDKELMKRIIQAKSNVKIALLDDFDTPEALRILRELVGELNRYMSEPRVVSSVLKAGADYVTYMFRIFGLVDPAPAIGYSIEDEAGGTAGAGKEETLAPFLDALAFFREDVRAAARAGDIKSVLSACDGVRDEVLPNLGVRLEDGGGAGGDAPRWKLEDPEELRKEREEKLRVQQEKDEKKRLQREAQERQRQELEARKRMSAKEYFAQLTDDDGNLVYSHFDEDGVPTHDANGEQLSKKQAKKVKKDFDKQQKLHEEWAAKSAAAAFSS